MYIYIEKWTGRLMRSGTVTQEAGYYRPPFRAEVGSPTNIGTITEVDAAAETTTDVTSKFYLMTCIASHMHEKCVERGTSVGLVLLN